MSIILRNVDGKDTFSFMNILSFINGIFGFKNTEQHIFLLHTFTDRHVPLRILDIPNC